VGKSPAKNNGFVHTAAHDARTAVPYDQSCPLAKDCGHNQSLNPHNYAVKTAPTSRLPPGIPVQPNYRLEGLRRYVPRRPEIGHDWTVDGEEFCDLLFIRASNVAATDT
jgi:hypothetical protein